LRGEEIERLSRPPKLIDPNTNPFFDSTTGKPQVWYWRGPNGEYEFYDNQGFHKEGDELKIINKDEIAAWKKYLISKQKEKERHEPHESPHF
jgi:hypothetical protein